MPGAAIGGRYSSMIDRSRVASNRAATTGSAVSEKFQVVTRNMVYLQCERPPACDPAAGASLDWTSARGGGSPAAGNTA